ncbi:translocation/assembly module TamB domain-containing protein [Marinobacter sp.]|uniref:translocation/assembly module TamB domain-containing protein n=1 Tax=Marinobacter sp. TaxID=50741 RepID=UPI00384F5290
MSRARRVKRILLVSLAAIIILPLLLAAGAWFTLRTDAGTAWLLAQIDGLEIRGGEGSLVDSWQAEHLLWQGYGVRAEVTGPHLVWRPSCLIHKTLCLDALLAEKVDLQIQPAGEAEEEPEERQRISLPVVDIPLAVVVEKVELGEFRFNQNLLWNELTLSAQGSGASLQIGRLYVDREPVTLDLSGRVTMRGDWPVNLDLITTLPPPEGEDWQLDLALAGSVRDLRIQGQSSGYLNAELEGRVEPLDPDLPARLAINSPRFLAVETLPPTLALETVELDLRGSLADGFQVEGLSSLPGARGAVKLQLSGHVTTEQADDIRINLSAPYHRIEGASELEVAGSVDWSGPLTAAADFDLQHFPWYDLVPDVEDLPLSVSSLTGEANYRDGEYEATLAAEAEGPLGVTTLDTSVAGNMSEVSLSDLIINTGAGQLKGDATLGFAQQLAWQAQLVLSRFNPGFWLPELEADLSGEVASEGSLDDKGRPSLIANWNLDGTWRGRSTEAHGELEAVDSRWTVSDLALIVGDNRISGAGSWHEQLEADLSLDLPDLSVFLPDLAGSVRGEISARGRPEAPAGSLALNASNIQWQDRVSVSSVDIDVTLAGNQRLEGEVRSRGLTAAGEKVSELDLDVAGTLSAHSLTIRTVHDQLTGQLQFSGGWQEGWEGELSAGTLELAEQEQVWSLAEAAALTYTPAGRVTLGSHCWQWQQSSVCAGDQMLMPDLALDYRLQDFPSQALVPLLPENLRWEALIDGQLALTMTDAGPDGRINLDAAPGEVSFLIRDQWQTVSYNTLATALILKPGKADLELELAGPELGSFTMAMTVDPEAADLPVDGRFQLQGLDVSLAGALADLEEIGGELNGSGTFTGPLLAPELQGELVLANGRLLDPSLPLPFKEVLLSLEFSGQEARVSGRWQSNARSSGQVDGRLAWQDGLSVDLNIAGSRLPITYEPYAHLEMAPDISVVLQDGDLRITGKVDIPRGEIEVRNLPPQAVSVSDDEVIVNSEEEEQDTVQGLNMDVTVNVGEDLVTFSGFGITGNLKGSLRIGNNMDTRGSLQLVEGSYKAYGQELTLRRARLVFVGPVSEPYLDIEAVREVGAVTAGLRLTGPVSEPRTEVFSEPPMRQNEALSYLVLGRPLQSEGDNGQLGQAALAMGLAQTGEITRGIGKEFGIEDLTLETEGAGSEASVVASGYISEKLSLRYGVGVFEPITKVALRYDLGQYFFLEAASGLAASLDLFYNRDF